MRRRKNRPPSISIDPETGDLRESGQEPEPTAGPESAPDQGAAPKRSGLLGAVKRVAADAVVRRTSSKF